MYQLYQEPLFTQSLKVLKTVEDIAQEIECQAIEVALAWVLAQENILTAIVGSRKASQVPGFSRSAELKLAPEHMDRLTAASNIFAKARS